MARSNSKLLLADPYGTFVMVRRLLSEYARAHRARYAIAFVLMALTAGCTALPAYLIRDVVNQAYVEHDLRAIIAVSAIIAVLFTVKGLATYRQAVILSRISNNIVANNQRRMFAKLMHESLDFYANHHSSEFVARMTTGATSASQVLNLLITALGRDLLSLIGLVIVMFVQEPVMALISFVVAPPAILTLRKMISRMRNIARSQFVGSTRIMETMQETLQGIRIVKAFSLEETMQARLEANVAEFEREANKMARVANRSSPLMETLGGLAIAIVLTYGGYRVIETGATPGEFFSFIAAFLLAYEPAKRLARLNLDLSGALVGVRILFEILDSEATEAPDAGRKALLFGKARIEFADVSFAYRTGERVIHDLSVVAEPGLLTALVGPSGGGKSTMLNLILRFYDIDKGAILIDGQNIAEVDRDSLRRQIAFVGQDVFLFRGSVRDNIAFGRPGASEEDIVAAAKAAFAHDFISAFPRGYDTPVGEHGLQLSGGQRQRIAIARALVKDAPIILLDEATASLDSESERQVQEAIEHLCQGRTTLVIAHRLHTVTHADRIHVIEDGTVVESGAHDTLLRKNGRYASFYRLQLRDQESRDPAEAASPEPADAAPILP